MAFVDRFLGKWTLDPARSDYAQGEPPTAGTYEIIQDGMTLTFHMAWTDAAGDDHTMAFSEVMDGKRHPFPDSEAVDEISLTLESDAMLTSSAFKGGNVLMHATRELLSDAEMKVTQSFMLPDGGQLDNISYYVK